MREHAHNDDALHDPQLRRCRLLACREVADLLGLGERSVWRLSATGEIPSPVRVTSRVVRWRATDLARYVEGLRP